MVVVMLELSYGSLLRVLEDGCPDFQGDHLDCPAYTQA